MATRIRSLESSSRRGKEAHSFRPETAVRPLGAYGCYAVWPLACTLALVLSLPFHLRAADRTAPVLISEFMANNQHGLKDEDGQRSGWIELHNASGSSLNLAGWFLTDSSTNLAKWRLPDVWLLPDKYLVVFASGKDRARNPAHLHTNFRLDPRGGFLALVNRATNIVSEFTAYPALRADTSYGCVLGDPTVAGRFPRPTPGKPNASTGPGFAPEVTFSRAGGTLTGPVRVALTCSSSGKAVIRYTTDGAIPNSRSPIAHDPITLTNSVRLCARAYEDGLLPGPLHSETYLFLDSDLQTFTSNLPVLIMDTLDFPGSWPDSMAHLSLFEPVNGRTSLTNPPSLATRAGFHQRGSSSMNLPKPSFLLHFLDESNRRQHRAILGMPPDSDWVLYAPNRYEPVMIHNPFVHQLSRDMGRYSPRTRFVEVYFAQGPGPIGRHQYQGIYVLEEKIKIGKHRVNIDRLGPEDIKPPEVTGGYLLKIDRLGPNEGGFWAGDASMVYVEPSERVISLPERAPQRKFLSSYFTAFEQALHGPNWKDPELGYRAYIDVDSWIDYHVLEVLTGNVDALVYSTYFYKPRGGKLVFGPHWDFDRALGSTDGRDDDPRQWNTGRFFWGPWFGQLFRDPDFWQLWVDRWQELRQNQFSYEHLFHLIDRLADPLRQAQTREEARWNHEPRGGSFQGEIDLMKEWLSNRIDFIDGQLVPQPALTTPGQTIAAGSDVTLNVPPEAAVYYTLDGSDPRLPQGAISPKALLYSGPIRLNAEDRLVARARDPAKRQTGGPRTSTPWSGPLRANFNIAPR